MGDLRRRISFGVALGGVAVVALVGRIAYLVVERDLIVSGDGYLYSLMGSHLADGGGFSTNPWTGGATALHPPAWPTLLAVPSFAGFDTVLGHQVFAALIGTSTVVLIALLGRRLAGGRAGLVAAALAAVHPEMWWWERELASEVLLLPLLVGALLLTYRFLDSPGRSTAAALGVVIGLLMLTRTEQALLLPLLVLPAVVAVRSVGRREQLLLLGVTAVGAGLVVAPWSVFNEGRFEGRVLLSTGSGLTLHYANTPATYSGDLLGYGDKRVFWSPGLGDETEASTAHRRMALDHVRANVGRVPLVVLAREARTFGLVSPTHQADLDFGWGHSAKAVYLAGFAAYWLTVPLAALGAVRLRRRDGPPLWPLLVPIAMTVGYVALTYGQTRYRVTVDAVLIVLAGIGVTSLRWPAERHDPPAAEADGPAGDPTAAVAAAPGDDAGDTEAADAAPDALVRIRTRARAVRPTTVGLIGALLLVAGIGVYLAGITPAYRQDESSHIGYTIEVRDGNLPTVTTPVRGQGDSDEMRAALARPYPFSDPEIHVANNPPFVYALAVPATVVTRALDVPGGGLLGFRLVSLAGALVGVGCSFLLGRELSGGDRFVGLVTAALVGGLISVVIVSSLANLDGPALGATTGVTWALARHARRPTAATALHLGLWCAAAAAVRPMALAFAGVAGLLGLVAHVRKVGWRSLPGATVRIGVPTVALTGWFYALNVHRYGDPTGSSALFEKYGTMSGPSLWTLLSGPEPFVQTLDYLVTDVYGRDPWWESTGPDKWAVTIAAVGVIGAAIALAVRSVRSDADGGDGAEEATAATGPSVTDGRPGPDPTAWILVSVLGLVPMVLIAQHMSGGGAGHARYLMPVLPIVAAATAFVTARINRWASVVIVAVLVGVEVSRIRAAGHLAYGGDRLFGPLLNTPILGREARWMSVAVALAGAAVLVGALVADVWRTTRPPTGTSATRDSDPVSC